MKDPGGSPRLRISLWSLKRYTAYTGTIHDAEIQNPSVALFFAIGLDKQTEYSVCPS